MHFHAAVSFADKLDGDIHKVYFTTRVSNNQAHTAFVDIDIQNPLEILSIAKPLVLAPSILGGFDDSGAMGCWLTKDKGTSYFYYLGWNLGVTVSFENSIGLAISDSNSNFLRYSPGPVLDRSMFEPHFTATPCVIVENERCGTCHAPSG